jgi:hypothetical protein
VNSTTKRFPRSLSDAFADERATCIETPWRTPMNFREPTRGDIQSTLLYRKHRNACAVLIVAVLALAVLAWATR